MILILQCVCFKFLTELTLLAGLGEVLSSGPSALLGIFRPPYFFQYIQQETHRRHCMFGGPHEYHWADCMTGKVKKKFKKNTSMKVRSVNGRNWYKND